jgi:hypothetical protein
VKKVGKWNGETFKFSSILAALLFCVNGAKKKKCEG